ncbi:hypothetical protein Tco_0282160, partial [Tanacetum coccineum]
PNDTPGGHCTLLVLPAGCILWRKTRKFFNGVVLDPTLPAANYNYERRQTKVDKPDSDFAKKKIVFGHDEEQKLFGDDDLPSTIPVASTVLKSQQFWCQTTPTEFWCHGISGAKLHFADVAPLLEFGTKSLAPRLPVLLVLVMDTISSYHLGKPKTTSN